MSDDFKIKLACQFLRFGLAFAFVFASVGIYLDPESFLHYIPDTVQNEHFLNYFLLIFAVMEILMSVWLLSGWQVRYAAFLSFVIMISIVVFNLDYLFILFRNIAISFAALALTVLEWPKPPDKSSLNNIPN